MSSSFKGHPDSLATRIEVQQLEASEARLSELTEHPEADDGPDWLDLTLDSTEEAVEAALQAINKIDRPVEDPLAVPLRPPGAVDSCPLDRSWRRWDMFNTPKYWEVPEDTQRLIDSAGAWLAAAVSAAAHLASGKATCRRWPCWVAERH